MDQKTTNIEINKYGKFIALVLGLVLIGAGIFMYFRSNELVRVCTEKATATVVSMREDFEATTDTEGTRYIYYPVIEYKVNENTVKGELGSGSNPPAYSIGDTVEILYNPGKTEEFIVAGENQSITWIIFGGLGIIFIAASIFLFDKK